MTSRSRFLRQRPWRCVAVLVLLALCAVAWAWRAQLQAFPGLISAYTAKEYCSCRYVMNNPVEYCHGYVQQWLPSTLTENRVDKRITATGMGRENSAQWSGQRQGCRLLAPPP
jgi:hypothetical protein